MNLFTSLFAAMRDLRDEINKAADFFRLANAELEKNMSVEVHDETPKVETNGHAPRRRLPVEK